MSVWFKSTNTINNDIIKIEESCNNLGNLYEKIVSLMPGLTSVDLVDEGKDFVTLKTNEGLMKRINIKKTISNGTIIVEYDEDYQARRMINIKSHCLNEFIVVNDLIQHKIIISDVKASGVLGFFYYYLGKKSIGNSLLKSYKVFFDKR